MLRVGVYYSRLLTRKIVTNGKQYLGGDSCHPDGCTRAVDKPVADELAGTQKVRGMATRGVALRDQQCQVLGGLQAQTLSPLVPILTAISHYQLICFSWSL